jgi:hypothetical protein
LSLNYYTDTTATSALSSASEVSTSGTYYILGVTAQGCSDTASVTVTVSPLVNATISSSINPSCYGGMEGSTIDNGTGGTIYSDYSYSWNTNPGQNSNTAINLSVGEYIVIMTDDFGCFDSDTIVFNDDLCSPIAVYDVSPNNTVGTIAMVNIIANDSLSDGTNIVDLTDIMVDLDLTTAGI